MTTLRRHTGSFRKVSPSLGNAWDEMCNEIDGIKSRTAGSPSTFVDDPPTAMISPTTPQPASFNVSAAGGVFAVQITNPQQVQPASVALAKAQVTKKPNTPLSTIYHNLQSGTNVNFDSASGFTDYGTSPQVSWNIPLPGVTLYWRVRSSFDGKNFNAYQLFVAPGNSGPTPVSS